ncbi:PQQ-binding-like beta-propeller repeat protein [bacterium]|nr:PQQ-binding-like beta-propeller repeat protein [bacterium]
MPSRHGRGPAPLFHKGWLYVEGMDAVRCVDAYNGRTVWECPLPGILKAYDADHIVGAAATGSNLCVAEGGVYVRLDDKCLRLDPATGKRLGELQAPKQPDGTPGDWGYLASVGDTVFGSLSDTDHVVKWAYRRADMSRQFGESLLLFALDAATGEPRWTYRPEHSIRNNTIAIGRGRVFVIDRPVSLRDLLDQDAAKRKGRPVGEHPTGKLIALNAADGKPVWTVSEGIYGTLLALSEEHGVVVMAYQSTRFRLASETGGRMAAFRASDGRRLWDIAAKYGSRPILNGRTLYAQPGAWDLLTGEAKPFTFERSYGCGTVSGSRNLLLFRSATLGYVDLAAGVGTEDYGGVRPGCWINAIAAGGLVLMPDATDQCRCSYLIKASVALQPYGLRAPAVSPAGGAFRTPVTATLSQGDSRAEIRYTVDGSPPSATSLRYTAPLRLATSATVMARAFAPGLPPSRVAEARFTIDPHILPIDGPHWKVIDAPHGTPPASDWRVADGVVIERSNLFQGAAGDSDPRTERPGALRVYTPGAKHADGELSLDLMSSDNDGLGVAFRFQGADRHYLWAMDQQRGFHILALKDRDTYRVLASRKAGYRPNQWYRLKVTLRGSKLAVHLDGQMDLEADDATLRAGSFALYAWGCAGARFRNVRWK